MRRVAFVLLAGLLTFALVTPAEATTTIDIMNSAFSPASKGVPIGSTVTWHNSDGFDHTSTQDVGLWDTGHIASGTNKGTMISWAATYPYHCSIHSFMHGVVKVPIQVTPTSATSFTITYASAAMPTGFTATVQKRVGSGKWTRYQSMLTGTTTTFSTSTPGTYYFRSFLVSASGKTKPSPKKKVVVS